MLVNEQYVNCDKGYRFGPDADDLYEPFTDDPGELFRAMCREYGRCISKVYIDGENGPLAIGWVFQKRAKYEDCKETYLQETWVTLHDQAPTVTRKPHYHVIHS